MTDPTRTPRGSPRGSLAPEPDIRTLSLGAGTQSTALFILGCEGKLLPKLDAAVFADTQWERRHTMRHLVNLQRFGEEHGVPVYLASKGDLPRDILDPRVYATIPAYTKSKPWRLTPVEFGPCPMCDGAEFTLLHPGDEVCADCGGSRQVPVRWEKRLGGDPKLGRIKRHCTSKYKIEVINAQVRALLGGREYTEECRYCDGSGRRIPPWEPELGMGPCSICRGTCTLRKVGQPPAGMVSEQWIGFSVDEFERVTDAGFPGYETPRFPLIELGWSREDCEKFLEERGWEAARSACKGCPLHGDDYWIEMKRDDPDEFEEVVRYDRVIRTAPGLADERFLHESRLPLDVAVASAEREQAARPLLFDAQRPRRRQRGCSPYSCRSAEAYEIA